MGLHSTLFGPVKFAYLPQHLSERELTGGNGMVEMGTFVAILLGSVAGGLLVAVPEVGARATSRWACLGVAVLGRLVGAGDAGLAVDRPGPASSTGTRSARPGATSSSRTATWSSSARCSASRGCGSSARRSWPQFPSFAKEVLHGDEQVASLLLVVFSVGIGVGSLLCEVLSRRHVEIGLVPLGAIGMSVFSIDLYFASRGLPPSAG